MPSFQSLLSDTLHLFYPHVCTGCGSDIISKGNQLCLPCIHQLPHTRFGFFAANPVEKYFWGRLPLAAAHSEFYFAKGGLVQRLIHQLKYKSNLDIGQYLGRIMGDTLVQTGRFLQVDGLVPLPLYPEKQRQRGYNQAAIICQGMSVTMNIPVLENIVVRRRPTETQTRKHRTERWKNVDQSFVVPQEKSLPGKHFLLVDDVVTTGATLEACGSSILTAGAGALSIATLAHADK
ncbi:MAG: phosphoribosyltransferase family protein [Ferruginibacter sp.]